MQNIKEKPKTTVEIVGAEEVHSDIKSIDYNQITKADISNFSDKAKFLQSIGMKNSITTKLYSDIASKSGYFPYYEENYPGCKFIPDSVLELVCRKFNLYVRDIDHYIDDIPEKNIEDIMSFRVKAKDLPITDFFLQEMNIDYNTNLSLAEIPNWLEIKDKVDNINRDLHSTGVLSSLRAKAKEYGYGNNNKMGLNQINFDRQYRGSDSGDLGIEFFINEIKKCHDDYQHPIEIAAIKDMFDETAFTESNERIIGNKELQPVKQVNEDPVVMIKVKGGRLIITYWGSEINNELNLLNL